LEEAAHYFKLAPDQGNADGQWNWAMQLLTSDAIPVCALTNASHYFRFSPENGSARGQAIVDWMAEHGIGSPVDLTAAVYCYDLASEKSRHACVLFSQCYETGRGVPVDFRLVAECFQKAAHLGDPVGKTVLAVALR
jgi:TPR repeat protein